MSSRGGATRNSSLKYRPDIDGLRAVAVMLAVVFHVFPWVLPCGFMGVDVFFVISGYLISLIIIGETEAGGLSFLSFYARRLRRLTPALLLVLATIWAIARPLLLSSDFKALGNHILHSAFFVENFLLNSESRYFALTADFKPTLHLWSLAVEEQFYLLWPLVLVLGLKRLRSVLPLILTLVAVSFAVNLATVGDHASSPFYLLPARFWELLLGAALAAYERRRKSPWPAPVANAVSLASAAVLLGTAVYLERPQNFPGAWALIPTLAAVGLIGAGPQAWLNRRVLRLRPVVFVGLVSYPFFLWHWPFLALLRLRYAAVTMPQRFGVIALAFALASATYLLVEVPMRDRWFADLRGFRARARCVAAGLAGMVLLGALGLGTRGGWLLTPAQKSQEAYLDRFQYYYEGLLVGAYREQCNFFDVDARVSRTHIAPECVGPAGEQGILLWGDSHAQHLFPGLSAYFGRKAQIYQVTTSNCLPAMAPIREPVCNVSNAFAFEQAKALKPRIVVLAQEHWHEETPWSEVVTALKKIGIRHVVVLGPVPQWAPYLHKIVARDYGGVPPTYVSEGLMWHIQESNRAMKEITAKIDGAEYISLIDRLCDERGCRASVGPDPVNDLVTWDYGHLTQRGSEFLVREVLGPELERRLRD